MAPSIPPQISQSADSGKSNTLSGQLRFWAIHCSLTALPSFLIAIQYFKGWPAIIAMIIGVLTFILGYGFLTSRSFYAKIHTGIIGRSVKLGARIRMIISVCSLPIVLIAISGNDGADNFTTDLNEYLLWVPDFWFGYISVLVVGIFGSIMGNRQFFTNFNDSGTTADFLSTYLITITEGLLISFSLLLISFLTLIILSFRKNRRQLPSSHFEQMPPHP